MPTLYSPQIRIHNVMQRGKTSVNSLPIYRDGAKVAPSSGTYTLKGPDGTVLVDAQAVSIAADTASYTVSAVVLKDTLTLSDSYLELWSLTIGTEVIDFIRPAAVARSCLFPVISDIDLEQLYSDLSSIRATASMQPYIDESWYMIVSRIRMAGSLEYLIMDPQALREAHINLCMYLFWRDCNSSGLDPAGGRYMALAGEHRELYEQSYSRINFRYDEDQSGDIADEGERVSIRPMMYTAAPPQRYRSFITKRW